MPFFGQRLNNKKKHSYNMLTLNVLSYSVNVNVHLLACFIHACSEPSNFLDSPKRQNGMERNLIHVLPLAAPLISMHAHNAKGMDALYNTLTPQKILFLYAYIHACLYAYMHAYK